MFAAVRATHVRRARPPRRKGCANRPQRTSRHDLLPAGPREIVRRRFARHHADVEGTRLGKITLEVGGIHVDAANDAARPEVDDAPIVGPAEFGIPGHDVAPPARFPTVHPLPTIGVLAFSPHRRLELQQTVLRREEFVAGRHGRRAKTIRCEIDELPEVRAHSSCPVNGRESRPPFHTRSPRTNVIRTTPRSRRPTYGVILCRCCSCEGSTMNSPSGSHTTRSAS